jgi:hypothetical protein
METDKPKTFIRLSRAELYEQVWSTRLTNVGSQYGISAAALARLCNQMEIPYPPARYWQKMKAGAQAERVPLSPARDRMPENFVISPKPAPPKMAPEVEAKYIEAVQKLETLRVPERLRTPHPIVAALISDHELRVAASIRDKRNWGTASRAEPLTAVDRRRHRILDTIFRESEKFGFKVVRDGALIAGKNWLEFSLFEYVRQVRRPLKPEENQETVPTGELRFKFLTDLWPGTQLVWADRLDNQLESRIKEILATIEMAAPFLEEKRVAAEENERIRLDAERKRLQEAARRKVETYRVRRFLELADQWFDTDRANSFVAAIEAKGSTQTFVYDGRSHDEWLAWIKERLADYDPLNGGTEAVWSNLASVTSREYND